MDREQGSLFIGGGLGEGGWGRGLSAGDGGMLLGLGMAMRHCSALASGEGLAIWTPGFGEA